jgi:hypothetical protein
MSHMVVYRSADGRTGYFQAEDLDRAVAYVEHLRNVEAVDDSRLYRMDEIPIEFKTYYRVEIGAFPAEDDEVDLDEAAHLSALSAIDGGLDELSDPGPSSSSSRFGLFGRS